MELLNMLTSQLGVTQDQAKGGAGLLFGLAKDQLEGDQFDQVQSSVPGVGDLLKAAPSGGGGVLGAIGGMLGGSGSQVAGLASLAGSVSKLGLDMDMIAKFIPIILSFVESKGGKSIRDMLAGVLK